MRHLFLLLLISHVVVVVVGDISLTCIAPAHPQRIAGGNIEFSVRVTFEKKTNFDLLDLCGSFDGNKVCGLAKTGQVTVRSDLVHDISWSLAGFLPSPKHTYVLWITIDNVDDASKEASVASCESSFETVAFPGKFLFSVPFNFCSLRTQPSYS